MRRLAACAVVFVCACGGTGVGISSWLSSAGVASAGAAYAGPLVHGGAVAAVDEMAPGPANPGGPYGFVTIPCHPYSCAG